MVKFFYFILFSYLLGFYLCNSLNMANGLIKSRNSTIDHICFQRSDTEKEFFNKILILLDVDQFYCKKTSNKVMVCCFQGTDFHINYVPEKYKEMEKNYKDSDPAYVYPDYDESECIQTDVDLPNQPWIALLGYRNNNLGTTSVLCNGALINTKFVLTTANCIHVKGYTLDFVRLGASIASDEREVTDFKINTTKIHPYYRYSDANVALVMLATPVTYTESIQAICISSEQKLIHYKYNLIGWSFERDSRTISLKNIEPIRLEQLMVDYGTKIVARTSSSNLKTMRSSCMASSGSALITIDNSSLYLVGLKINGGMRCHVSSRKIIVKNNIFTNIAFVYDWIDFNTNIDQE